jgi:hypothetical protein
MNNSENFMYDCLLFQGDAIEVTLGVLAYCYISIVILSHICI